MNMEKDGEIERNKKGQLTIFIIVGLIIVALAFLIYMFFPKIIPGGGFEEKNPSAFMQSCLENKIQEAIDTLSQQGGSIEPEHYFMYEGERLEYLCYTEEYYKTCVMQQPLLKKHVEEEIKKFISVKTEECFNDLEDNYKNKGYNVNLKKGEIYAELLPKRVVAKFDHVLSISKDGNSEVYGGTGSNQIRVAVNNNLYELVSIATSILNMEARYGDSETTIYMDYYRDLKVEKKKQSDGTKVYILTDRNNGNKFQFASRSVAWPPGYGLNS